MSVAAATVLGAWICAAATWNASNVPGWIALVASVTAASFSYALI